MDISVSTAASLFKEFGHDLKGIYQLLHNAVETEWINRVYAQMAHPLGDNTPYGGIFPTFDIPEYKISVKTEIKEALEKFTPDAEWGEKRILEFKEDYKRLKELSEKIKPYSFWALIFRVNKQLRAYLAEKRQIESKTISLVELLQVAYFKFTQIRGTKKQFIEGFERYLQAQA